MSKPIFRVIVADTPGGVAYLAVAGGWTLKGNIEAFSELDTLDDGTLGIHIGRLFVNRAGWAALACRPAAPEDG